MINQLKNAIIFGMLLTLIGYFVSKITGMYFKVKLPDECKEWNKKYIMEMTLFFTGTITYFIYIYLVNNNTLELFK